MCATCGCSDGAGTRVAAVHQHDEQHQHDHPHTPSEAPAPTTTRTLEINVLAKNDNLAGSNRRWLRERRIAALNLMSSPGSGKTTLLVRTLEALRRDVPVAVIEGDQETQLDANRIAATGVPVVQVNTGAGCHLDAEMIRAALDRLDPPRRSLLFVENVGNLVCPALFDLGETAKIVVSSVTEGHDKPLKYPQMFAGADLLVVNKSDLLPYVDFDVAACIANARAVNPALHALVVSATTGDGLDAWYSWLRREVPANDQVRTLDPVHPPA